MESSFFRKSCRFLHVPWFPVEGIGKNCHDVISTLMCLLGSLLRRPPLGRLNFFSAITIQLPKRKVILLLNVIYTNSCCVISFVRSTRKDRQGRCTRSNSVSVKNTFIFINYENINSSVFHYYNYLLTS